VADLKGELATLKIDRTRPKRSAWRWPLLLLVPALLALAVFYGLRVRQTLSAPEIETVTVAVSRDVEPSAGTPILTASGYVVARRQAVVSAKIQGRLEELRVEEGSEVRKGDVLARLESFDFEAAVNRAPATVQRAEADHAEQERRQRVANRLAAEKVLAADQREAAESRVRIAQAQLAQQEADLAFVQAQMQNTIIRAPFDGVVIKKMAEVGESVAPIPPGVNISIASGAIVALADLATLEVEADVAEANVAKVSKGQPAEVTVEAIPDRRYEAVLRQVIPTADRTKATVMVKVTILDKDQDLKPEMSAKVTFLEPEPETGDQPAEEDVAVVLVPRTAVVSRGGSSIVFLVREGKVQERPVVLGTARKGQVIVKDGLAGGETLVARPPDGLADGDAVRIKA
jgi:HlyD family secretion protein